jgi:SAM-dependent methyltransferase
VRRRERLDDYYNPETRSGPEDVAHAGWRRRIGQWLRFEAAIEPWNWDEIDTVLDVGCGPASLADYMAATDREAAYTGVECRSEAVEFARDQHPEVEIIEGDLFEPAVVAGQFDLVVAIGTQVDGRPVDGRRERLARVRRLVERCNELALHGAAIVVLKQEMLQARPAFGLEPAIFGVTADELEALGDGLEHSTVPREVSGTDRALFVHDGAIFRRERADADITAVYERVVEQARQNGGGWTDIAWLWLESGYTERARCALERASREEGRDAEIRHLYDRLQREISETGDQ